MAKKSPTGSTKPRKSQRQRPYKEGDWVVVPLRPTGWAVGRLARAPRSGILLGYFFGPRRDFPPTLREVEELEPSDAIARFLLGDMGLLLGEWPVLGQSKPWDRELWPVPIFVRRDIFTKKPQELVQYEEDMLHWAILPIDERDLSGLPEDELLGYKAVEIALSMELGWAPEVK